jgi:hypothetical protein
MGASLYFQLKNIRFWGIIEFRPAKREDRKVN